MTENKYITVAYKLFAPMQGNERELIEEATEERPFQFISALGMTPEEVTVVGDSLENDILPARQLGCRAVWLNKNNKAI